MPDGIVQTRLSKRPVPVSEVNMGYGEKLCLTNMSVSAMTAR